MGKNQFSYWFVRGYFPDKDTVFNAIQNLGIRHYAFIEHNRCVFLEDDEQHHKGDPKVPHWHLCLNLESACSFNVLKKRIESVAGKNVGLRGFCMRSPKNAKDYLFHESVNSIDSGKVHYEHSEAFSDDLNYWDSEQASHEVKLEHLDYLNSFVDDVLEQGFCEVSTLLSYKKTYGRDFIFNYRRALLFCADVLQCPIDLIFINPEKRSEILNQR